MIERIYILCLIIMIKSEVCTITHCLGLGHETMVCVVCLLYSYSARRIDAFVTRDCCKTSWCFYITMETHTFRCVFKETTLFLERRFATEFDNTLVVLWIMCCTSSVLQMYTGKRNCSKSSLNLSTIDILGVSYNLNARAFHQFKYLSKVRPILTHWGQFLTWTKTDVLSFRFVWKKVNEN